MQSLRELVKLGASALWQMALEGQLEREHLWVAARGAAKYAAAVRAGRIRTPEKQAACVRACENCPSMVQEAVDLTTVDGDQVIKCWCGPKLEERFDAPDPTCGCLVALKINGKMYAAAKSVADVGTCDQGRWEEERAEGTQARRQEGTEARRHEGTEREAEGR